MASSTLTGLLKQVAGQFPSRRAVQFDLTHARLQELIDQAASQLVASGVKPGDMVALTFPNTIEVFKPFTIVVVINFRTVFHSCFVYSLFPSIFVNY
ncbi:hypothetical protein RHGRI_023642 [Rhododendron griersonianum]|uniref:AMP-dependent synthetase/ligase domain-containing protein n=1 Tax=Rhododendron griersonianum TaxID=479676 RepID=A0AAV6J6J6_9ERIC|nr:hypothetical protein RHGRI_023642 [Rhododendron griersonianum]